jgi:hypothetical protein
VGKNYDPVPSLRFAKEVLVSMKGKKFRDVQDNDVANFCAVFDGWNQFNSRLERRD